MGPFQFYNCLGHRACVQAVGTAATTFYYITAKSLAHPAFPQQLQQLPLHCSQAPFPNYMAFFAFSAGLQALHLFRLIVAGAGVIMFHCK